MSSPDLPKGTESPSVSETGRKLADVLLRDGAIDELALQRAARVHGKLGSESSLYSVLQRMHLVDEARTLEVIRRHRPQLPIGELLVQLGYLEHAQLRHLLQLQSREEKPVRLGDLMVSRRMIKAADFTRVLASQLGFLSEEPEIADCEEPLLKRLVLASARRYQFVPVRTDGDEIVVAFVDPLHKEARAAAVRELSTAIRPVMTSPSTLERTLDALERRRDPAGNAETRSGDTSTASGRVNRMLSDAIKHEASDIHLEPLSDSVRIRFRIDGVLREMASFDSVELDAVISRLKIMAEADISERRRHQDGRIAFEDPFSGTLTDMRASFYVTVHGECVVIRVLNQNSKILSLARVGMASTMLERFQQLALDRPSGVVMITGPTGSGKTSTLYSCIQYLNDDTTSIITAEDPVEFQLDGITQCSVNVKAGRTFEESLRHVVRQDPDVIVLGEIRDQASAESAIQAALTGHKVLTTFHTEDSIGALLRLMNMSIEAYLISSTVACVVAQRLIRRVCVECATASAPDVHELQLIGWSREAAAGANFAEGIGCETCLYTGFRGRVPVFEALILTEPVREAILMRKTADQIRKISVESSGLVTLLEDGLVKAANGDTTLKEVRRMLPRLSAPRPLQELRRLSGRPANSAKRHATK